MANITVSETNQAQPSDSFWRFGHFLGAVFTGNALRPSRRNLGSLDDYTLADIGLRRDQLPLNYHSFNENNQRFYWVS